MKTTYSVWIVFPNAENAERMLAALRRYGYGVESLDDRYSSSWTSDGGEVTLAIDVESGKTSTDSLLNSLDMVMESNNIQHIFRLVSKHGAAARWNVEGKRHKCDDVPESGLLTRAPERPTQPAAKVWLN